jgi:hypothetical protein
MCTSAPTNGSCNKKITNVMWQAYNTYTSECGADIGKGANGTVAATCDKYTNQAGSGDYNQCQQPDG